MPGEIVVHEYGDPSAPPLVLLHGLTDAGTTFPDAVERWEPFWHIYSPDLRGHGESPRFAEDEMHSVIDIMLKDVTDFLLSFPTPPVAVTHSLGGHMAIRALDEHPNLLRGLVLEDPWLARFHSVPLERKFAADTIAFLTTMETEDGMNLEIERAREYNWTETEIFAWAACKINVDRHMIPHSVSPKMNWKKMFNRFQIPVVMVKPESGPISLGPTIEDITNPNVKTWELPNVGHTVRRDDEEAYHAIVDPFLEELRGLHIS
ncbi:MAG: alpha/beta hydrolase [Propionibacteriaceae bacterium]|jgi:pimeloyl-ACP methyl ester carboxylesterase|nr:alpha/beta hydrolase [Propionibacteriaceae bacterium]